ncbi:Aspartate/ornithine carbamoyltransferase [Phakopsora pachyrhizi]|nr:Aspartate/ornithine carbamoyltransferase [Phakopsora pachyrhizi]
MNRLGGRVVSVSANKSSATKGRAWRIPFVPLDATAFLDVYTIREELGTVNGLTITMVGDLKNGRTVHSLVNLIFVSPISLAMPDAVKVEATRAGITYEEFSRLDEVIGRTDVLYMTRVQQERFENPAEYEALKDSYRIDHDLLSKARKHTIILHPLPRNSEIDPEVDLDPLRAAYFRRCDTDFLLSFLFDLQLCCCKIYLLKRRVCATPSGMFSF